MNSISIAIVTYNNETTIGETLDSVRAHIDMKFKLFVTVIDNGSTDGTLDIVRANSDLVELVQSPQGNVGFGAAHNLVIPRLNSDVHIIMNPDVTIKREGFFEKAVEILGNNPTVSMLVPSIYNEKDELQYLCRRDLTVLDLALRFSPIKIMRKRREYHEMRDMDYEKPFEVPFASGCCMLIRTELFVELGGFDERYFLYAEDADLCRSIRQRAQIQFRPELVIYHLWERASYKNARMTRIHIQSLRRYFKKWGWKFK